VNSDFNFLSEISSMSYYFIDKICASSEIIV